jgi:hypothetical protein
MIRSSFSKVDANYKSIGKTNIKNIMFTTTNAFRKGGIDGYIRGSNEIK